MEDLERLQDDHRAEMGKMAEALDAAVRRTAFRTVATVERCMTGLDRSECGVFLTCLLRELDQGLQQNAPVTPHYLEDAAHIALQKAFPES